MRNNKGFLELRRLEAARDIAEQLSTSGNKVMLDSSTLLLDGQFCLPVTLQLSQCSCSLISSDQGGCERPDAFDEVIYSIVYIRPNEIRFSARLLGLSVFVLAHVHLSNVVLVNMITYSDG
jgi:hypothetical protein